MHQYTDEERGRYLLRKAEKLRADPSDLPFNDFSYIHGLEEVGQDLIDRYHRAQLDEMRELVEDSESFLEITKLEPDDVSGPNEELDWDAEEALIEEFNI